VADSGAWPSLYSTKDEAFKVALAVDEDGSMKGRTLALADFASLLLLLAISSISSSLGLELGGISSALLLLLLRSSIESLESVFFAFLALFDSLLLKLLLVKNWSIL